jgi:hypothetical protein
MLHVMGSRGLRAAPPRARQHAGPGWLKVAASLALLTVTAVALRDQLIDQPAPAAPAQPVIARATPVRSAPARVETMPLIGSAARTITASLQQPLMDEAQSVVEDTRRAADFVVSCLPFTSSR